MTEPVTVPAFATPEDLGTRLKRTWTTDERPAVQVALEDASAYLRGEEVIGRQVWPPAQASFTVRLSRGARSVGIPALPLPVVSVDSVTVDGEAVEFETDNAAVYFGCCVSGMVVVTFTAGYAQPPANLTLWACVLASQALQLVEELGQLGGGGVSSFSIDDYRKAWANGGDGTGYSLPVRIVESLRKQYGQQVFVTGSRA